VQFGGGHEQRSRGEPFRYAAGATPALAARLGGIPIPGAIQQFIDRQADAATTLYDDSRAVVFNGGH
jgi:hypothetical protein